MPQVRVTPSGSLDKDTDISYIRQGNYTDALNIRHRNSDGQNFGGVMSIGGNNLEVTIPNYTSSTQEYIIYFDGDDIANGKINSHTGKLKLSTGDISTDYQEYNYASTTAASTYSTITGHLTSLASVYNSLPAVIAPITFIYGSLNTTGTNKGYFSLTTTSFNEFKLFLQNIEGQFFTLSKISEYQPDSGSFSIVGSKQVEDDLFVFLAGDDLNTNGTSKVSEIGNIYPNPTGSGYLYVPLVTTKSLTFHPERNIEIESEVVNDEINLYWTDNFNVIRYVRIPFANRRATSGLIGQDLYSYDNIDQETSLILFDTSCYIDDIDVIHGGGNVSSGNKRYSGRFVTSDFQYSDFLYPTGVVNIYDANPDTPYLISGNADGTLTTKLVKMSVKNLPLGIYSYFDLVVIEYGSTGFSAKFVERFSIERDQTELDVLHTNLGQRMEDISGAELYAISDKYNKAKSLTLNDQRLTISNLSSYTGYDLSDWAQSITHSLETHTITGVGYSQSIDVAELDYKFGEYLDPKNTLNFTSYMINDTYRFGIQVQWSKTGGWSRPFWVDDIRFDTSATNIIGNRRSANNVDSNITDIDGENVNVYYVKFGNINLNDTIDGFRVGDLIKSFRFVRSKRIPEVLATGIFLPGAALNSATNDVYPFTPQLRPGPNDLDRDTFPTKRDIYQWPFITDPTYDSFSPGGGLSLISPFLDTDRSDILFFHSPDIKFNQLEYSNQSTDTIKILGVPGIAEHYTGIANFAATPSGPGTLKPSEFLELDGYVSSSAVSYVDAVITDHETLELGDSTSFVPTNIYNYDEAPNVSPREPEDGFYPRAEVFKVASSIYGSFSSSPRINEQHALYYGQLFRDLGGHKKYPSNKSETVYEGTGHIRILEPGESGILSENVFGGDVYNQKTVYQLRMKSYRENGAGEGYGISFYSQNVANTQMFQVLEHDLTHNGAGYVYPQSLDKAYNGEFINAKTVPLTGTYGVSTLPINSMGVGLFYFLQQWPEVSNQSQYSSSYTYADASIVEKGYDPQRDNKANFPTRIAYSARKQVGSENNSYRNFQPANIFDLDLSKGEITSHLILNDNLYTVQPQSVQRQYFRDGTVLNATDSTDIIIGAGGILTVPGAELTPIGTNLKSSIIKGKTQNGKDVLYWYNSRLQKIIRLSGNSVDVLTDRGLSSYFRENGKYNKSTLYPLSGLGVHGVWNDKYSELIYTFKYNDGVTNKAFTIAYDEAKNGFVSFHSYAPNLYMPYDNTFFTPNPSVPNTVYLHDEGTDGTYYGSLQVGNITFVMNYEPNLIKQFEAIQINSDKLPFETDFYTEDHQSYLDETDFIDREGLWYSPIKNDTITATFNTNSEDTTRLFGKWIKVKFSMEASSGAQKLLNGIVKFRISPRLYTQ